MIDNLGYIQGTKTNLTGGYRTVQSGNNHICQYTLGLSEVINAPVYQIREDWCGHSCERPLVTLGLFTSTKRNEPLITHRRLVMSNNTVLLTIQDRIADVSESIKFIIKNTEGESGQTGQISCLLNVLSATLQDAWSDLSDYTFENKIGYPDAN